MTPLRLTIAGLLAAAMATSALAQTNLMHNYEMPADVDGNSKIQANDVRLIITELERLTLQSSPWSVSMIQSPQTYYWDANNDSYVNNRDALLVINRLINNVPEPSTLVSGVIGLLAFAGYGVARVRGRRARRGG